MRATPVSVTPQLEERAIEALARRDTTRHALAKQLKISRTTLTRALAAPIEDGYVRTDVTRPSAGDARPGRPVAQLSLAGEVAYLVAVDITRTSAGALVVDRALRELARAELPVLPGTDWVEVIEPLQQALEQAARAAGADLGHIAQLGIGVPVPVVDGESTQLAAVRAALTDRWGAPVLIDNIVRMLALGEARWGAGRDAPDQIHLNLGGGIGACVITADSLARGATGLAGELGHVTVPGADADCYCGKRGCVETVAGTAALCRKSGVADLAGFCHAWRSGRPKARQALERAGQAVADAAASPVLALGIRRVVVGGEVAEAIPEVVEMIGSALAAQLPPILHWTVQVVPAELTGIDRARGALAALEANRSGRHLERFLNGEDG